MKDFPPKSIVVAVDLSAAAQSALDAAKVLARRWGSSLELLHVRPPEVIAAGIGPDALPVLLPRPDAEDERRLEQRLRAAAADFPPERTAVRVVRGWILDELRRRAARGDAGLLVMGTHGYAGLDRFLLGSVAEAVVRASRAPVLTVPESAAPLTVSRILAPWNGRPYAARALRYARALALSLGAEVRVLHVVPNRLSVDESESGLERRLENILGPGRAPAWSLRVRSGDAREQIAREAASGRFDLLVLSAHRRPFSTDIVVGSTVERLLRRARVPVLAVPTGKRAPVRRRETALSPSASSRP